MLTNCRFVVFVVALAAVGCGTSPGLSGAGGSSSGAAASGGAGGATSSTSSGSSGSSGSSSVGSGGSGASSTGPTGGSSGSGSSSSGHSSGASGSSSSSSSSSSSGSSGFDPCPATGNCKILPLGDSITYGSTSNNGGYRVDLFARAVTDNKPITFVGSQSDGPATVAGVSFPKNNEGHPGWTIAQIAAIATNANALKDSPNIVLLHIGTNDLPNAVTGASDRLAQLVDQIVAARPSALLVVAQIIPLPWAESSVVTYNAAIPGVVQQRANQGKHVILVDMNTGFPTSNGYASDNIHPNDSVGYPWMGDRWYAAIKPYLH